MMQDALSAITYSSRIRATFVAHSSSLASSTPILLFSSSSSGDTSQSSLHRRTSSSNAAMNELGLNGNSRRPSSRLPPSRRVGSGGRLLGRSRRLGRSYPSNASNNSLENRQPQAVLFPVSAIHIAQKIDLQPVLSSIFAKDYIRKQHLSNKNSFVVELPPNKPHDPTIPGPPPPPRYVAVFRFGSIVGFNIDPREMSVLVSDIKKFATEPVANGLERQEKFGVLLKGNNEDEQQQNQPDQLYYHHHHHPTEERTDETAAANNTVTATPTKTVTGDFCIVPELDLNGVAVISHIMAQTVALDSYNGMVDDMLSEFAKINETVTKTGSLTRDHKDFLFKSVAQNNSIFIDMISKIRIKDRSDTVWNLTKYENIHYGMKEEFEIDDRFDHIEFKLNLIQQNSKFFLEVLQDKNSNFLEWTIVILILVECCLMCVEMSGFGEIMFGNISKMLGLSSGSHQLVTEAATTMATTPTEATDIVASSAPSQK